MQTAHLLDERIPVPVSDNQTGIHDVSTYGSNIEIVLHITHTVSLLSSSIPAISRSEAMGALLRSTGRRMCEYLKSL